MLKYYGGVLSTEKRVFLAIISKTNVSTGIFYVEIPDVDLRILCGCPADTVKHLMRCGLILSKDVGGSTLETGPNAILLSDVMVQGGALANMSEFPVLQMLYRQGMIVPGHPGNTGAKPLLIGSADQVQAQLKYLHRGNYGLVSEQEMRDAGASPEMAKALMREKLKFAFGAIRDEAELFDAHVVDTSTEDLRDGVAIRRVALNKFEITYEEDSVMVDLNLADGATYASPYPFGVHNIDREYFSILHSGDGDGWDINRPSMASTIMFQGRPFLIDAGPNIDANLDALGIGVNEIEGIFMTHAHDDHFAGLVTLMRADHRIKFFATSLVKASVVKKLSALLQVTEDAFDQYFDAQDLRLDDWNDLNGLEVRPVLSPHPVETTVLEFRTLGGDSYRTYSHFADIVSFDVLEGMVTDDESAPGISAKYRDQVKEAYLRPANLKKLDIGGGMIHGQAEDFAADRSDKIILAHTSLPLTDREKEIGSGAPYGTVDRLIESHQEYVRRSAHTLFTEYLPEVDRDKIRVLLNNSIITFNPESIILRQGESTPHHYLVLTGTVDVLSTKGGVRSSCGIGAMIGERSVLQGFKASATYRARSFVNCLKIPGQQYLEFVSQNNLLDEIIRLRENKTFLRSVEPFSESLSGSVQSRIARAMQPITFKSGEAIPVKASDSMWLIKDGHVDCDGEKKFGPADYFGDGLALFGYSSDAGYVAADDCTLYRVPVDVIADIPVIRWKLYESFNRCRLTQ